MYGIYTNIGGILMVNVTIYSIHGSYGLEHKQTWTILNHQREKFGPQRDDSLSYPTFTSIPVQCDIIKKPPNSIQNI